MTLSHHFNAQVGTGGAKCIGNVVLIGWVWIQTRRGDMPALTEYANVSATAFEVLRAKGFQVWFDERMEMYCAERDGWDFLAQSPCALLGVVAIFEYVKPVEFDEYWWRLSRDTEIPIGPLPYTSVIHAKHGKRPGRPSTE